MLLIHGLSPPGIWQQEMPRFSLMTLSSLSLRSCHYFESFTYSLSTLIIDGAIIPSQHRPISNSRTSRLFSDQCRLLITFANSLDPDQARQNVGPDLDRNYLTLWWCSWKISPPKKLILDKCSADNKKHAKLPSWQIVKKGVPSRGNLSSGFVTRLSSYQSAQLQRLARNTAYNKRGYKNFSESK